MQTSVSILYGVIGVLLLLVARFSIFCGLLSLLAFFISHQLVESCYKYAAFSDFAEKILPEDWLIDFGRRSSPVAPTAVVKSPQSSRSRSCSPSPSCEPEYDSDATNKAYLALNSTAGRELPWKSIELPDHIDTALEELLDAVISTYVTSYYYEYVSEDQALVAEIRYQLRYTLANLYKAIVQVDLSDLIIDHGIPMGVQHGYTYTRIRDHFGAHTSTDALEQRVLDYLRPNALHSALYSRGSELEYLRKIAEFACVHLADESRLAGWPADLKLREHRMKWHPTPRHFLRELLVFCVFLPLMDLIADPDTINDLLIILFSPEPIEFHTEEPAEKRVFLRKFMRQAANEAPDSLIQMEQEARRKVRLKRLVRMKKVASKELDVPPVVPSAEAKVRSTSESADEPNKDIDGDRSLFDLKLSEIIRQPNLLYLLMTDMKETGGPLNSLQFILNASDIQQKFNRVSSPKSSQQDGAHVHWECWELYKAYIHPDSPERVDIELDLVTAFERALEQPADQAADSIQAINQLEQALLPIYQDVYHHLQFEYIIPFCQSETYIASLVGERPVIAADHVSDVALHASSQVRRARRRLNVPSAQSVEDDWDGVNNLAAQQPGTMAVSKIRNRFRGLFGMAVEEGGMLNNAQEINHLDIDNRMHFESSPSPSRAASLSPNPQHSNSYSPDLSLADEPDEDLIDMDDVSITESASGVDLLEYDRDISKWKVAVPRIEPRKDNQGRTTFVYVIDIKRQDLPPDHPRSQWAVDRRYNEFFVLESKLLEFHGESVVAPFLPAKKTFSNKSREFIESMRPSFDSFIQRLAGSPVLSNSELMAAFLTSAEEFRENFIPNAFNPFKGMKKVGMKLSRERGQGLNNFMNELSVSSLMFGSMHPTPVKHSGSRSLLNDKSDTVSMSSNVSGASGATVHDQIHNSIFNNNSGLIGQAVDASSCDQSHVDWLLSSTYDLLLFTLVKVADVKQWLFVILVALRVFLRDTLDSVIRCALRRLLRRTLHERTVTELIQLTYDSLFVKPTITRTTEQKRLTEKEARQMTHEFLVSRLPSPVMQEANMKVTVDKIFDCLQMPRLNKQLSYVLLDAILKSVFPELTKVKT